MSKQTFNSFVAAINGHDVAAISALMSDDHLFIDAVGTEVKGKEQMTAGWTGYFTWFPDYRIEVTQLIEHDNFIAAFGYAEGSYKGNKADHWRIPASWQATAEKGKVKLWQVYADTKIPFDIMAKAGKPATTAAGSKKVTSIGGVFFKCKHPDNVKAWYAKHLGLNTDKYGTNFEWYQGADNTKKGYTQWSPFSDKTKYFEPSTREFMINYRVEHIEALVEELKRDGVTVVDAIETYDYGKFVHILDCENNKIELWEPNDIEYAKITGGVTK